MNLRRIRLQNFRNIAEADIEFTGSRCFFVGPNGQGKTNLLEAIGYVSALRAFRPGGNRVLIREGEGEAALGYSFDQEQLGTSEVTIRIRPKGKSVELDRTPIKRLRDLIGHFPTVLFASEDIYLVRGAPSLRRRLLDLHFASLDAAYLDHLQRYHRALDQRNRLLKSPVSGSELSAFERELAPAAAALIQARRRGVHSLQTQLQRFFSGITGDDETATLEYRADIDGDEANLRETWRQQRERDTRLKMTEHGPHRDDLLVRIRGREAAWYASEGQQRAFVLALRFAQLADARDRSGLAPVVLADDVLGELDLERRRRFWSLLDPGVQLLASGTQVPDDEMDRWQQIHVRKGRFEN